ncbi:MAG: hypothetical protein J07HX5_00346 [halophilic archaeon J07HX5]|jgi:hypothetical protein|nr:MAG: hypothetical protein J07HX5_00346 [halophilic archaeon J07HX5]
MELTRRDAMAALAAIGVAGGVTLGAGRLDTETTVEQNEHNRLRTTMVAVATVVYPNEVSGVPAFVNGVLDGRLEDTDHAAGIQQTVAELNDRAVAWYGGPVPELSTSECDSLLREVGADTADEDPNGTTAEQVRYYVINELLFALYASPTGGKLVGIENPQGYPGGTASYSQGPE